MNISMMILPLVAGALMLVNPLEGSFCETSTTCCSFLHPCGLYNVVCQLGKCECPLTYFYIDGRCEEKPAEEHTTIIVPIPLVANQSCHDDYNCRETANSVCNIDRQCDCQSEYFKQGDECVPRLNSPCENSIDCGGTNLECVSGQCKCNQVSYEYHDRCLLYASSIPECYGRLSCPGEFCDYSKCSCDEGYVINNGRCVGKLESRCISSLKCYDKIMTCVSGRCQCAAGHFRWLDAFCLENDYGNL